MKDILTSYGINTASVSRAVNDVNFLTESQIRNLAQDFALDVEAADTEKAVKHAIHAILTLPADRLSPVAVVGHVYKNVAKRAAPAVPATVALGSGPLVCLPTLIGSGAMAVPVFTDSEEVITATRRKRPNAMTRAVEIFDDNGGQSLSRDKALALLAAEGIGKSSAVVYFWKYQKGLRE